MDMNEIIKRLEEIVSMRGNGFCVSDSYEINARGGNSDLSEARADGRDEVCDDIRDLINELKKGDEPVT